MLWQQSSLSLLSCPCAYKYSRSLVSKKTRDAQYYEGFPRKRPFTRRPKIVCQEYQCCQQTTRYYFRKYSLFCNILGNTRFPIRDWLPSISYATKIEIILSLFRLEHDLKIKSNSLFIDREKCLSSRKSFPVISLATKL